MDIPRQDPPAWLYQTLVYEFVVAMSLACLSSTALFVGLLIWLGGAR